MLLHLTQARGDRRVHITRTVQARPNVLLAALLLPAGSVFQLLALSTNALDIAATLFGDATALIIVEPVELLPPVAIGQIRQRACYGGSGPIIAAIIPIDSAHAIIPAPTTSVSIIPVPAVAYSLPALIPVAAPIDAIAVPVAAIVIAPKSRPIAITVPAPTIVPVPTTTIIPVAPAAIVPAAVAIPSTATIIIPQAIQAKPDQISPRTDGP